jgi:hypothetical protein
MRGRDYLDNKRYLAECLALLKEKCEGEGGNKATILKALHQCFLMRARVPRWLQRAFVEAYESAARFEIRSWDEAFGPAQEKGIQLGPRKKHADLRERIAFRVAQRKPHEKIGDKDSLFATIAKELKAEGIKGVGASTVHKIYYERGGKELHEMIDMFRKLHAAESPAKSTSTKN